MDRPSAFLCLFSGAFLCLRKRDEMALYTTIVRERNGFRVSYLNAHPLLSDEVCAKKRKGWSRKSERGRGVRRGWEGKQTCAWYFAIHTLFCTDDDSCRSSTAQGVTSMQSTIFSGVQT